MERLINVTNAVINVNELINELNLQRITNPV